MGRDRSSPGDQRWDELAAWFPARRGARAVVVVEVERIADSCGYAVPLYDYAGERDLLDQWAVREDEAAYRGQSDGRSIDGLPALSMVASDWQAARAEVGLSSCLNAAGMLPGDHSRGSDRRHVDA
jgi:hypothetical protein